MEFPCGVFMENKKDNWIYFGVFLDEESKNKLYKTMEPKIPEDWKIFCHHMTIAFNNKTESAENLYNKYKQFFGEKINITATHFGRTMEAMAVNVDFDGETLNKYPHVTVATSEIGKPVESNFITVWKTLESPIQLTGILNAFYK